MRPLRVFASSIALSAGAAILCDYLIGGRLGLAILFGFGFVLIRNGAKLALAARPFTLGGRPLPVHLYFAPAPTYVGPNEIYLQLGFFSLVIGIILAAVAGYLVSSGPLIAPLAWPPGIAFGGRFWPVVVIGAMYGLQIILVEFRPPRGDPFQSEPWLTIVLVIGAAALVSKILQE